jgi:phosphoketolase
MNTLTVPKIKDLVNKPKEQYKDIFQTIEQKKSHTVHTQNMTDELASFLKDLKKNDQSAVGSDKTSANANAIGAMVSDRTNANAMGSIGTMGSDRTNANAIGAMDSDRTNVIIPSDEFTPASGFSIY